MKFDIRSIVATASVASLLFLSACDWSSGSQENFNTNDGSNISGFYEGQLSGGLAVGNRGWNIRNFTIQQSGNTIRVVDSKGSVYDGNIGNRISSDANRGAEGSSAGGTAFNSFQLSFSGTNRVTGRDATFAGTVVVVVDSVILGVIIGGDETETITEDTLTMNLKGTWVESGSGTYTVEAQVIPFSSVGE